MRTPTRRRRLRGRVGPNCRAGATVFRSVHVGARGASTPMGIEPVPVMLKAAACPVKPPAPERLDCRAADLAHLDIADAVRIYEHCDAHIAESGSDWVLVTRLRSLAARPQSPGCGGARAVCRPAARRTPRPSPGAAAGRRARRPARGRDRGGAAAYLPAAAGPGAGGRARPLLRRDHGGVRALRNHGIVHHARADLPHFDRSMVPAARWVRGIRGPCLGGTHAGRARISLATARQLAVGLIVSVAELAALAVGVLATGLATRAGASPNTAFVALAVVVVVVLGGTALALRRCPGGRLT